MSSVLNHAVNPSLTEIGFAAGSGAVAALALTNPIGAAGGAIVGVTGALGAMSIQYVCGKVLGKDKKMPALVSKIISAVAGFFAAAGAAFGVSTALGYSVTFGAACMLSAATFGVALGVFSLAAMLGIIVKVSNEPKALAA